MVCDVRARYKLRRARVDESAGHPPYAAPTRVAHGVTGSHPGLCFPTTKATDVPFNSEPCSKEIIDAAAATPAPCGVSRRSCANFRPVSSGLRPAGRNRIFENFGNQYCELRVDSRPVLTKVGISASNNSENQNAS